MGEREAHIQKEQDNEVTGVVVAVRLYRLSTLGQTPASIWDTEYSAFLASGKRCILQIAVDWPLSHSAGGIAGQTSVSHLSFSCSTCDIYSWPAQLLAALLRPAERQWVVLVILSVDVCPLRAGTRLSGRAWGPWRATRWSQGSAAAALEYVILSTAPWRTYIN